MFLMDVGYIQYYYQLPGHWLFWKEGQAFVLFSFHLVGVIKYDFIFILSSAVILQCLKDFRQEDSQKNNLFLER
jgi:hypothetical protein